MTVEEVAQCLLDIKVWLQTHAMGVTLGEAVSESELQRLQSLTGVTISPTLLVLLTASTCYELFYF